MTDTDEKLLHQRAMGLRVLTLALIVGVVTITGVFMVIHFTVLEAKPLAEFGTMPVLSIIAVIVAIVGLAGSVAMPARMRAAMAEQFAAGRPLPGSPGDSATSRLLGVYAGSHILGMAL